MLADKNRHKGFFQDLENEYLKDQDNYPRTLNQAYSLLVNWKAPTYIRSPPAGAHDGVIFTQGNQSTGSQPSSEHSTTLVNADTGQNGCRYCKETGHEVDNCPKLAAKLARKHGTAASAETTSAQLLTAGLTEDSFNDQLDDSDNWLFLQCDISDAPSDVSHDWVFLQQHGLDDRGDYLDVKNNKSDGGIPMSWVLLDNQSTVDVFMNRRLLQNIRTIAATMKIHCNAGISHTNQVAHKSRQTHLNKSKRKKKERYRKYCVL